MKPVHEIYYDTMNGIVKPVVVRTNRSAMKIGDLTVYSPKVQPNVWYRFWQRFFCDIRWEDITPPHP